MGYRISELARRSGFSASTLRYYETVGLMPHPDRTGAGYRVYDEDALERLAFIARAKTLGLALVDIAELLELWADGSCAPVQDRLLGLLNSKVGDVRSRLAELATFAAQLEHLRDTLAATEPAERCGPGCGCDSVLEPDPQPDTGSVPIACTLSARDTAVRTDVWADVLARVTERQLTADGVRLRFPDDPDLVARVADLAVREADCCAFFSFTITIDATSVWFVVSAPADGRPVLDALLGTIAD